MVPRSFYFLRHGETDWNLERRLQGNTDIPLNTTGRRQAGDVISILRNHPIDRIITSNLTRARETAQIVNNILRKPIIVDEDLRERHYGVLEGHRLDEIREFREMKKMDGMELEENGYPCAPGAEPYADFKKRAAAAIARHLDAYPQENILFVAHGGIFRVLFRGFFGREDQSPNAHPLHFLKGDAAWEVKILE